MFLIKISRQELHLVWPEQQRPVFRHARLRLVMVEIKALKAAILFSFSMSGKHATL